MPSKYYNSIRDYIFDNQPCTRPQVVNSFPHLSYQTVYRHINTLINQELIVLTTDKTLVINSESNAAKKLAIKQNKEFLLPPVLSNFEIQPENLPLLSILKSAEDPEVITYIEEYFSTHGRHLLNLIVALQILAKNTTLHLAYPDLKNLSTEEAINLLDQELKHKAIRSGG